MRVFLIQSLVYSPVSWNQRYQAIDFDVWMTFETCLEMKRFPETMDFCISDCIQETPAFCMETGFYLFSSTFRIKSTFLVHQRNSRNQGYLEFLEISNEIQSTHVSKYQISPPLSRFLWKLRNLQEPKHNLKMPFAFSFAASSLGSHVLASMSA